MSTPRTAAGHLAALAAAQADGRDEIPPVVPPHLIDTLWRFHCGCREPVLATASAEVRSGKLAPPRRFCPRCTTWASGRLVSR